MTESSSPEYPTNSKLNFYEWLDLRIAEIVAKQLSTSLSEIQQVAAVDNRQLVLQTLGTQFDPHRAQQFLDFLTGDKPVEYKITDESVGEELDFEGIIGRNEWVPPVPSEGQLSRDYRNDLIGEAAGYISTCWVGGTGSLEFDGGAAADALKTLARELDVLEESTFGAVDTISSEYHDAIWNEAIDAVLALSERVDNSQWLRNQLSDYSEAAIKAAIANLKK